jgi:Spy/CpxP family protein refolding chaperone
MKLNKTTIVAIAVLLLAGVAAVALINRKSAQDSSSQTQDSGPKMNKNGSLSSHENNNARAADRTRNREEVKDKDLVAEYGESRTNLSRHISNNIVSLLDDAVQMGEMMQSGQAGGFGGGRGGLGMALGGLNKELNLTDEQQEKASKMFADYQKRQLANSKEALERLRKDPSALMKLMLAGDASARGELSEDELKSVQTASGKELTGVINPLDRNNFGGGSPLKDGVFLAEFKSTLDPEQSQKLEESMTQTAEANSQTAAAPEVDKSNISNMPTMELEKLDSTIQSAKKITTGIKGMMEGFSGLNDLAPKAPEGGDK